MDFVALFEGMNYGRSAFPERVHTMKGRILWSSCNKHLNFVVDTATPVAIIPMSLAERNKLEVVPTHPDEHEYEGVTGMKLSVVGQTEMVIKIQDHEVRQGLEGNCLC